MTITQLETFQKIAETRNFTTAANALGYAQSTVTTQIKQLEEELGCLLFERLGKTIVMTPEGDRLLLYSGKMLQLEREVFMEVPGTAEPSGVLKLGISESLCYNRIPGLLLKYRKMYPKVDLQIQFVMHDTFPDQLKKGELDFVYTINPMIEDENLSLLYKKPETLGFYVSPSHPLAKKRKVDELMLQDEALLLTGHNCAFKHMLVRDLEQKGIAPKIAIETSAKEVLKQFAASGLGVAFMPDMAAETELKNKSLVRLKWSGEDFPIYSQIFIHKDKRVNGAIKGFLDLLQ